MFFIVIILISLILSQTLLKLVLWFYKLFFFSSINFYMFATNRATNNLQIYRFEITNNTKKITINWKYQNYVLFQVLLLNDNHLEIIWKDQFKDLNNLHTLTLHNNRIIRVDRPQYIPGQVTYLSFEKNRLNTFPIMQSDKLEHLVLSYNNLTVSLFNWRKNILIAIIVLNKRLKCIQVVYDSMTERFFRTLNCKTKLFGRFLFVQ